MNHLAFLFSIPLLLSVPAAAQSGQPSQDQQATALMTRAVSALTGGSPTRDITLTGTATWIAGSDTETGPATLTAMPTGQSRTSLHLTSGPRSEVRSLASDGSATGAWSGPDRTTHSVVDHNLWTPSVWFFPEFILASPGPNPTVAAAYVGQETRNGLSVQHLTLAQQVASTPDAAAHIARLSRVELYLDSTSSLPVAIVFAIHPDKDSNIDIPVEVDFSNYQTFGSAMVPLHVQRLVQNSLVLDLQLQSAALNTGLTPSAFATP